MEVEITKEEENKLLKRREIEFTTKHLGKLTPTRADARAALLPKLGAKPKALVLKKLVTSYGGRESVGTAYVYETEEAMEETEPEHIIERNFPNKKAEAVPKPIEGGEKKKKEEAKPEEKKEMPKEEKKEASKEEKKEEAKPTEKKEEKPTEPEEEKAEAVKPPEEEKATEKKEGE